MAPTVCRSRSKSQRLAPLLPLHFGNSLIAKNSIVYSYVFHQLTSSISLAQPDLCTLTLVVDSSELICLLLLQDSSPTGKMNTSYWMYLSDQN